MSLSVANSDEHATCPQGEKKNVVGKRNGIFDTPSQVATFYPSFTFLAYTLPVPTLLCANSHLDTI